MSLLLYILPKVLNAGQFNDASPGKRGGRQIFLHLLNMRPFPERKWNRRQDDPLIPTIRPRLPSTITSKTLSNSLFSALHLSGASSGGGWKSVCRSSEAHGSRSSTAFRSSESSGSAAGGLEALSGLHWEPDGWRNASSFWALQSVRTIWWAYTRSWESAEEEALATLADAESPGSRV